MGRRHRARGLLDPILRSGPLRRPGHPECIDDALDPTTCHCNGSDVACTIALRVDCLRLLRPSASAWTRPDRCRSYASRRSFARRRNTVIRDGRGRPVHEPHHVETRVEGALHDPLIERHDVGQQAGRHKVGDGEIQATYMCGPNVPGSSAHPTPTEHSRTHVQRHPAATFKKDF